MDGHIFEGKNFWIVRVDPGEDVLISLKSFIKEKGIEQGLVVMGYGTLAKVRMHCMVNNQWPPKSNYGEWEGGMELMSMNGIIIEGRPHVHFTASTMAGAFGGHLEEGCICYILCEVGIVELEGTHMARERASVTIDEQGQSVNVSQLRFS